MDSKGKEFIVAKDSLQGKTNPLARTLKQMYDDANNKDVAFINYNDECPPVGGKPGKKSTSRGHTKGLVQFGKTGGYWLIHSTPRWPHVTADGWSFPFEEATYGQSYLCLTFKEDQFSVVGDIMQFSYPQFCESKFEQASFPTIKNLGDALNGKHFLREPWTRIDELTTVGGQKFNFFAKDSRWGKNLYEDLVASTLKSDLRVETWQNGVGKMGSFCKPKYPFNTENIVEIAYGDDDNKVKYTSTKDHSKWAIASPENGHVCIGGINRQKSQAHRSGGTTCFKIPEVYKMFDSMISKVETCKPSTTDTASESASASTDSATASEPKPTPKPKPTSTPEKPKPASPTDKLRNRHRPGHLKPVTV
jgi:deoxyribonuclease II